jgi:hypothetical protein
MTYAMKRIRSSLSILTLVSLAACISEMPRQLPTEPPPPRTLFTPSFVPVVATKGSVDPKSLVQSSRVKYSDLGAQPGRAQGRMASVEIRALLDKQGSTLVDMTTGTFDGRAATATIEKVTLRALTAGTLANARPETPEWSHSVSGLVQGDRLNAQANVRGAGESRMEVLAASTVVVRRPDVSVLAVSGAAQVTPGTPVTFFADVAELNGDLGARANCRLYVNGEPADQASAIWVDAGDIVTCQFSYSFANSGTYTVAVSAIDVAPGDWDVENNGASTMVTVVDPGTPIAYGQLTVDDANYEYLNSSNRSGAYPLVSNTGGTEKWSKVVFFGLVPQGVPVPVQRVEARVMANGTTIHEATLSELASYSYVSGGANVTCIDYFTSGQTASSCTRDYPDPARTDSTWFSYSHQSGRVTYYGQTLYCHLYGCNPTRTTQGETVYSWGAAYGLTAGSVVRLQLRFIDASGTVHQSDRSTTLINVSENFDVTTCAPYFDGLGEVCTRRYKSGMQLRGMTTW